MNASLCGVALGYHPCSIGFLTCGRDPGWWTMSGGSLTGAVASEGIGGAQRFPSEWSKPFEECKGRRELDCDTDYGAGTKMGLSDPVV